VTARMSELMRVSWRDAIDGANQVCRFLDLVFSHFSENHEQGFVSAAESSATRDEDLSTNSSADTESKASEVVIILLLPFVRRSR
jgi:hypothetical protein